MKVYYLAGGPGISLGKSVDLHGVAATFGRVRAKIAERVPEVARMVTSECMGIDGLPRGLFFRKNPKVTAGWAMKTRKTGARFKWTKVEGSINLYVGENDEPEA